MRFSNVKILKGNYYSHALFMVEILVEKSGRFGINILFDRWLVMVGRRSLLKIHKPI